MSAGVKVDPLARLVPRPCIHAHRGVAGGDEHAQDEGSEEGAADDPHDSEGALGGWVGVGLKAGSPHLS